MIDKIPTFDDKKLAAIEGNAARLAKSGTDTQKANANEVLSAIADERKRRKEIAAEEREQMAAEIVEKVRDKGLFERVLLAFTEQPPKEWEIEVLREIAKAPDRDGTTIAQAIGKQDVGYVNLAVGTLCSNRELYLGIAPPSGRHDGKKNYSSLIIDFKLHKRLGGSSWYSWTLKPEAHAALKRLGIVA